MKDRIDQIQQLIEEKEALSSSLVEQMHDPANAQAYQKLLDLEKQRVTLGKEVEALYEEWESLSAELEANV